MARVHTIQKARKAQGKCSKCGTPIKVGDGYRCWAFRFGPKYVRCMQPTCTPKPSELTQSEFYSTLYSIQESLEDALQNVTCVSDISSALEQAAGELRDLGEQCQEKFDNMPEGLQQGDTGQLLENRVSECESKADELENAASELSDLDVYEDPQKFLEDHDVDRDAGETDEAYADRVKAEMEQHNEEALNEAISNVDTDLSIE